MARAVALLSVLCPQRWDSTVADGNPGEKAMLWFGRILTGPHA